jgi:hypothetical protein
MTLFLLFMFYAIKTPITIKKINIYSEKTIMYCILLHTVHKTYTAKGFNLALTKLIIKFALRRYNGKMTHDTLELHLRRMRDDIAL